MKKDYFALYNAMYDKLAPLKSDEELLDSILSSRKGNITMKHENKSRKLFSKAVVIPIAAALALGATAVGAVAVYNHSVTEEYANVLAQAGEYFKPEFKDVNGEELDQNAIALNTGLYDTLNIELGQSFEYEDFTLDFPGAICDGKEIMVMFNMTFKKDLDCLAINDQNFWIWGDYRNIDGIKGGTRAHNGILTEIDGKKVYKGFIDYSGIENCGDSVTLHFEEIKSAGSWPARGISRYETAIDVDLDIPLNADNITSLNKTITADTAQHVDLLGWGDWDVESVDISPLAISFNVKTEALPTSGNIFKTSSPVFPVNVTMKDGSTMEIESWEICRYDSDEETKTATFTISLNYPLNSENVQSVQFASVVIDADGTATTVDISEIYEKYDENGHLVER